MNGSMKFRNVASTENDGRQQLTCSAVSRVVSRVVSHGVSRQTVFVSVQTLNLTTLALSITRATRS